MKDRTIFGNCIDAVKYQYYIDMCIYDMCSIKRSDTQPVCLAANALIHECKEKLGEIDTQFEYEQYFSYNCAGEFYASEMQKLKMIN